MPRGARYEPRSLAVLLNPLSLLMDRVRSTATPELDEGFFLARVGVGGSVLIEPLEGERLTAATAGLAAA